MPSRPELLAKFLGGVVAKGWPYDGRGKIDLAAEPLRGYLQLREDGVIEFEAISDAPLIHGGSVLPGKAPEALAVSTPLGGAILLDVHPRMGGNFNFGGTRESVVKVRASSLLFDVDLPLVANLRFLGIAVQYDGLGAWGGMRSLDVAHQTGSGSHPTEVTIKVTNASPLQTKKKLPGSLALQADSSWTVDQTRKDSASVTTALRLTLRTTRARAIDSFTSPLLDIQDLLSIIHRGWVPASPSFATIAGYVGQPPLFWNRLAMHPSPRAIEWTVGRPPLYALRLIGGIEGIARWACLYNDFRPVVSTVTSVYREGPEGSDALILKLGAAIERFVAAHRKTAIWADKKAAATPALALAKHTGGPAFRNWIGDPAVWAKEFQDQYNASKHHTPTKVDPAVVALLVRSSRWLLTVALLDRIARTKKPSIGAFRSAELSDLGSDLRSALGT